MIIGIGSDIVDITRISQILQRRGVVFAKRILTKDEFSVFIKHPFPTCYLAKRFSVKEAASKALGLGIGRNLSFKCFNISNNELGAPKLIFRGFAKSLQLKKKINSIHVSLSDEEKYACSFVVLESI